MDPILNNRHVFLSNYMENCLLTAIKLVRTIEILFESAIHLDANFVVSCINDALLYYLAMMKSKFSQHFIRLPFNPHYLKRIGRFAFWHAMRNKKLFKSIRLKLKINMTRVRIYNDLTKKIK